MVKSKKKNKTNIQLVSKKREGKASLHVLNIFVWSCDMLFLCESHFQKVFQLNSVVSFSVQILMICKFCSYCLLRISLETIYKFLTKNKLNIQLKIADLRQRAF